MYDKACAGRSTASKTKEQRALNVMCFIKDKISLVLNSSKMLFLIYTTDVSPYIYRQTDIQTDTNMHSHNHTHHLPARHKLELMNKTLPETMGIPRYSNTVTESSNRLHSI